LKPAGAAKLSKRFDSHTMLMRPCVLILAGLAVGLASAEEQATPTRLRVTVTETAGIRRFGYPVTAVLPLGRPMKEAGHFRLLLDGKPIPAQFRPGPDGRSAILDFAASPGPLEKQTYAVEYGPDVEAGPEPKGTMRVAEGKETLTVAPSPGLEFELPRERTGLLHQVRGGKTEYLRPGSSGLLIRGKDKEDHPAGAMKKPRVTRTGPFATALLLEGTEALAGGSVKSTAEMEFPRTKSWVRVAWAVEDPEGQVAGLGAELLLNLEGTPTLIDFGAGSNVYAALREGQAASLRAGGFGKVPEPWETLVGPARALKPYVVAPGKDGPPAEGWAHVMDKKRCTAVAVEGFAAAGQEAEIRAGADGRLRLGRTFAPAGGEVPKGTKRLTFWLHFVGMPVQVGAATSPQAMLAPLRVEVR
jgi:hypothetical protein